MATCIPYVYHNYPKYSERQALANADLDHTQLNGLSDQCFHCLLLLQQFSAYHPLVKCTCSNFRTSMVVTQEFEIRSEMHVKMVHIDYPIRQASRFGSFGGSPYRIVDLGHLVTRLIG